MMSTSIEQAFVKHYEADVFQAYQRQGSKLRSTVRSKSGVVGSSAVFQKVGKGIAQTKARHGAVPVMNLERSVVEATLQDYYAGDWIDKLDDLKTESDERSVIVNAGAYALGRKTDEMIINQLASTTNTIAADSLGLTLAKIQEAFESLSGNDVPDDGQRYAIVGWKQWSDLLTLKEFASAEYVGDDALPFVSTQAKKWLGTLWIPHSGLPLDENGVRTCFWYHKAAVGHASGADVESDITWHGDKASYFVNNMMSQGAILVDDEGVIAINCDES